MASFILRLEEPGGDYLADQLFPALRDALEPGANTCLEETGQKIANLLPEDDPDSSEAHTFCGLCIELAEQIPYNHERMTDVVTLLQIVLDSPRLSASEHTVSRSSLRLIWPYRSKPLTGGWQATAKYRKWPYRAMGLPLADEDSSWSAPIKEQDRAKCVSFYTFEALLYKNGIMYGATLPVQLLCDALEGGSGVLKPHDLLTKDIRAMAATQVILILGHQILFKLLNHPVNDLGPWCAGSLYGKDRDPYCMDRWHFWQDTFRKIAAGKWDKNEKSRISDETKQLAIKAADIMDAIEKEVGTPRRQPDIEKTEYAKHSGKSIGRKILEWL